jgi:hypothetical protein
VKTLKKHQGKKLNYPLILEPDSPALGLSSEKLPVKEVSIKRSNNILKASLPIAGFFVQPN